MDNYVGKRLDGRYEIHEIIGVGGMAVVYKAFDNIDKKIVAVKILKEEYLADEDFKRRFKNESKAIAVLSHPNIVKVLDVSFGDRLQYIVMEYVEGITLKEYIEQQGVVRTREALYFVMQILRALQHAHDKGIVHRDIKPQNIMLIENGSIKVTDFGIATFSRGETKTMTNSAIGSVHYISPEQAKGSMTDAKSDIYSVGVVLYEMLTGSLPFQSDNAVSVAVMQVQKQPKSPREINPDIPIGLEQIIMRAMQKNPAERYQSAAEMLVDLGEFGKNPNIKFDYNFFVDKAPTKYIPTNEVKKQLQETGGETDSEAENNQSSEAFDDEEERKKKKTIGILAGVLGGLIIFVIVMIIIFASGSSKKLTVPNFIGLNYTDDIASNDKYEEFMDYIETKFVVDAANEDGVPYEDGEVFNQTPEAGKKISEKSKIVLEIASNNASVAVPDVYGYDIATAMSALRREGFLTTIDYDPDSDLSDGIVVRTSPERNEKAPSGSTVTIFIPGEAKAQGETVVVPILV
ncbi:MAG: Stk1 family PASTA domain-containing Ser/Thr kinase, partial [Acutalibacteraceae bacterium]